MLCRRISMWFTEVDVYYSTYRFRVTTGDNKDFVNGAGVLCDFLPKLCMLPAGGKLY